VMQFAQDLERILPCEHRDDLPNFRESAPPTPLLFGLQVVYCDTSICI